MPSLPNLSGLRFNKGTIIVLTIATFLNIGSNIAAKHKWIDWSSANDIRTLKEQIFYLLLGQTGKAVRKDKTRDTDTIKLPKSPDGGAGG